MRIAGSLAALPFLPKVVTFGLIVGVASRNAGWGLGEVLFAALGVNAATAQLAALEFRDAYHVGALAALTLGLNAKHLLFTASLWPQLQGASRWRAWLAAAMVTDSSWTACQLAAQRGALTPEFILGNAAVLTAAWTAGCAAGFQFGAVLTPQALHALGLDALVPLSMALLLPLGVRRHRGQWLVVALAVAVALLWWKATGQQAAAVLAAGLTGIAAAALQGRWHDQRERPCR
jgi:predicted branched-subunit amino acid permease